MKKELLILLMIVSSAVILTAGGKQDNDDGRFYGRGQGRGMTGGNRINDADRDEWFEQRQEDREKYLADLEVISVTGALTLVNGELPFIESEGSKVYIMAPWYELGDLELENGMEVTVEGYEMPARPLQWDDSEKSLMVTKAVINGEEIVVEHHMDGNAMRGGRGGSGRRGGFQGGGMMRNQF